MLKSFSEINKSMFRVVLLLASASLIACSSDADNASSNASSAQPQAAAIVPIRVSEVTLESSSDQVSLSGVTQAKRQAALSFQASGRLSQRVYRVGAVVAKDTVLAEIDNPNAAPAAAAAQQQWRAAQARLRQATANAERFERLLADQAITQQEYEAVKQSVETAAAQEQAAQAQARGAQRALDELSLRAPFAGVITADYASEGDLIQAGQRVMEMADPSAVEVEVNISPNLLDRVSVGDLVSVTPSLTSSVGVIQGEVVHKSPFTAAGTLPQVVVSLPADQIQPGVAVEVILDLSAQASLEVPLRSVFRIAAEQSAVYKIVDQKAQLWPVELVGIRGGKVAIRPGEASSAEGLKVGDVVARDGVSKLYDGAPVEIL